MSVQGTNQHLRVIVGKPAAAADVTAMAASTYGFVEEGTAAVVVAIPAGKKFQIAHSYEAGNAILSQMLEADPTVKDASYAAEVQKIQKLTIPAITATGDETYILKVRLPEYGGNIGAQDEYFVYANYVAVPSDTATKIAKALADDMKKSLTKLGQPVFKVTQAAAVITFTGIAQPYKQGKFTGKQADFDASITGEANAGSVTSTAYVAGVGTYKQVAGQEEFFAGYNEDYKSRQANWPAVGDPTFNALVGKTYDSHTISWVAERKGFNNLGHKQVIQIWEEK